MKIIFKHNIKKVYCLALSIMLIVLLIPNNTKASSVQNLSTTATTSVVTFDPTGGTVTTSNKSVTFGSKYGKLPTPTLKNYEFIGWFTYAKGGIKVTKDSIVRKAFAHTVYAHWSGTEVNITLDANGGEVKKKTVAVYYGSKYEYQLPTPTRENYDFAGWYTAKKDGEKITKNSIFDENSKKKLYAVWTAKTIEVTFVSYNGDNYSQEFTCGKKYGTLPTPVKEGYTFNGWYTWEDYSDIDAEPITTATILTESSPRQLFARWDIKN